MREKFIYTIDATPKLKSISNDIIDECIYKLKAITTNKDMVAFNDNDANIILDFVINKTWNMIADVLKIDIENNPLTNRCDLIQAIVGQTLEKLNVRVHIVDTQKAINDDVNGHSFLVVGFPICDGNSITEKYYLVDPTYRQFFLKENCCDSKYLIKDNMILLAPDPGYYYLNNPGSLTVASNIIENGYIELNDVTAKIYGDSFYTTRRGYAVDTYHNKDSKISGSIYIKSFLKANNSYSMNSNQLNEQGYEIKELIGSGKTR